MNFSPLYALKCGLMAMGCTMLGDVALKISPDWLMDIRTICAVGGIVVLGVWKIGRWVERLADRLERIEDKLVDFPCKDCPRKRDLYEKH